MEEWNVFAQVLLEELDDTGGCVAIYYCFSDWDRASMSGFLDIFKIVRVAVVEKNGDLVWERVIMSKSGSYVKFVYG